MNDLVTDKVLEWLMSAERSPGARRAEAELERWFRPWVQRAVLAWVRRWSLRGPDWQGGGLAEVIDETLFVGILRQVREQVRRYLAGGRRPRVSRAFLYRLVSQFLVEEYLARSLIRRTEKERVGAAVPLRVVSLKDRPADEAVSTGSIREIELRVALQNALACLGEPTATLWRLYLSHLERGCSESEAFRRVAPVVALTPRQVESRLRATRPRIRALLEAEEIRRLSGSCSYSYSNSYS